MLIRRILFKLCAAPHPSSCTPSFMSSPEEIQESAVNRTVQQLRAVFEPMARRLTPDVEPATIYFPAALAEASTAEDEDE